MRANLLFKFQMSSALGGFASDPLNRGYAPEPRWELCPRGPPL